MAIVLQVSLGGFIYLYSRDAWITADLISTFYDLLAGYGWKVKK